VHEYIEDIRYQKLHPKGDIATSEIARIFGSLASLLLLAECSLPRRRA
jgi:hypothetical protein